jgi:hypothetical protein
VYTPQSGFDLLIEFGKAHHDMGILRLELLPTFLVPYMYRLHR